MAKKKKIADDKYLLEEFSFKTTFKKEKKNENNENFRLNKF